MALELCKVFDQNLCCIVCQYCGQFIKTEEDFIFHYERVHPNPQSDTCTLTRNFNFNCRICSKVFISETYLTSHVRSEHIKNVQVKLQNGRFYCDACPSNFKSRTQLDKHLKLNLCNRLKCENRKVHLGDITNFSSEKKMVTSKLCKSPDKVSKIPTDQTSLPLPLIQRAQHSETPHLKQVNGQSFPGSALETTNLSSSLFSEQGILIKPGVTLTIHKKSDNPLDCINLEPNTKSSVTLSVEPRNHESQSELKREIECEGDTQPEEAKVEHQLLKCVIEDDFEDTLDLSDSDQDSTGKERRFESGIKADKEEDLRVEEDPQESKEKKEKRSKSKLKKDFSCKICGRGSWYRNKYELSRHLKEKHEDQIELFPCTLCDFKAIDKKSLALHLTKRHIALKVGKLLKGNTCKECGKHFRNLKDARYHVQSKHFKEDAYSLAAPCEICGKILASSRSLKMHMKSKHDETFAMKCVYCEFKGNQSDLKVHIQAVHRTKDKPRDYKCDICGEIFVVSPQLQVHVRESHGDEIKCRLCDLHFAYNDWSKHISLVHDEGLEEFCDYCDFKSTLGKIQVHQRKTHPKVIGRVGLKSTKKPCHYCPEEFWSGESMSGHLKLCHPDKIESCVCDICGKTFPFQKYLLRHKNDVHVNQHVKCKHCSKTIKSKRAMTEHLSLVHDIGPSIRCVRCDFMATKGKMSEHQKSVHKILDQEDARELCTICNKLILTKYRSLHQKTVHLSDPKPCSMCSKTFKNSYRLTEHVYKVHKLKPDLKCEQCEFTTNIAASLRGHVKTVHLNLKEFICDLCGTAFSQRGNLKTHIQRIHIQGGRPNIFPAGHINVKKLRNCKVRDEFRNSDNEHVRKQIADYEKNLLNAPKSKKRKVKSEEKEEASNDSFL